MSRLTLLSALALLVGPPTALAAKPENTGSRPVFAYPIQKTVLDNGLTVLSIPFDSPGIIAYYTVVRTGSRNEVEKGLSGFAHFFEHMMFRGTDAIPADKYNDLLKSLGADFNAFTNEDQTCYHMTIPATALATAVAIEADRFQNLKYDEPSFQKEARAVLGEYNKSASSPFLKLIETMQNTAYTTHTYKHTTIGFLADIKDMPNQYAYSKIFFDRWYRPENCTIIAAGDVKHESLVALVKQDYGGWKPGKAPRGDPRRAAPERAQDRTADLAAADAPHASSRLPHSGRRPRQPRHGRLRRTRGGRLRRDQPPVPGAGLEATKNCHDEGRRRSAATRACSRSWCGCGSPKTCRSSVRGSPPPSPRRPRHPSIRRGSTRSSRICAMRSPVR